MSGFQVDAQALTDIAGRLRGASDGLDALAGTIPAPPADGPGAALVAQLLAALVERSAEIAVGLRAASDVATACHDDYRTADGSFAVVAGTTPTTTPAPVAHPAEERPA